MAGSAPKMKGLLAGVFRKRPKPADFKHDVTTYYFYNKSYDELNGEDYACFFVEGAVCLFHVISLLTYSFKVV